MSDDRDDETLSGKLTSVGGYRKSICQVKSAAYALRRINALPSPLSAQAQAARSAGIAAAHQLIEQLGPFDFEVLVDLIFARSGWSRVSALGGFQPDSDLILVQPATGERALVQVKSRADAKIFGECLKRYRQSDGLTHLFFVCHSPRGQVVGDGRDVHVWTSERLAELATDTGLLPWLAERAD